MIKDNVFKIKGRIDKTCLKIDRDPAGITIVAVTKGRTGGEIKEVIENGICDIGENKVQEAISKYNELSNEPTNELANQPTNELTNQPTNEPTNQRTIRWHMVGHLQTNKAKDAVTFFDLIDSVDSLHLAQEINRQAAKINKVQEILIEIKTSPEATKFGLRPEEVADFIREATRLKNIDIKGLMTIAPIVDNPEKARPYFRQLRLLRDKISDMRVARCDMRILSMGMTDDFEVAIEEGATMVRLGRAIFEG